MTGFTPFRFLDDDIVNLRTTALHALHRAAGARMVDFAGWDMPVHYGSQIEEHHAVRRAAGMFDVSHMRVVDVCGKGAENGLRRLLANDVARLEVIGKALYTCMLDDDAGIIDDLIVYRMTTDDFRLVVNAGTAESDVAWMRDRMDADVSLAPRRDLAMIAVQGPRARALCWEARPRWKAATEVLGAFHATMADGAMIARTGYTGEDGYEIMLPSVEAGALWTDLAGAGVRPAGLGARDTLRLEAGMNLYGQDMDRSVTPMECGLAWTVSGAGTRPFTGSDALRSPARWTQVGAILRDRGVMRSHQQIRTAHGDGVVTSGGFSPTLERSIALCRVPATVRPGEDIEVEVRGRWLGARTVKPPFVRRGRILIEGYESPAGNMPAG